MANKATGNDVLKAYNKAVGRLERKRGNELFACAESAGIFFAPGQKRGHREGYQVFVKVIRYSDEMLKEYPDTGGLLAHL